MGLHLDVLKEGKLVQKLMIDEKKCYFFGRNRQLCDFPVEHESCSRVHAALVWHKFVSRPFLIDLGSTHASVVAASVTAAAQNQDPDSVDEMGAIANSRKRRRGRCITFADEDDVINPEDLGLALPNLTPDVDVEPPPVASTTASVATSSAVPVINNNTAPNAGKTAGSPAVVAAGSDEAHEAGTAAASSAGEALDTPRKKKYAKEAWPGKKPGFLASG
uniref:FHA domain-containing protein n=1 Tax=Macrostomum lignano TaxID=282301 RepID=A0A1I8GUT8_9PLAT